MTSDEIRACYRLYAAHRKSREICTFPGTIPATSNAGDLDDLAVLLRLHSGLEGLARDIGHGDPNDDVTPGPRRACPRHLRKHAWHRSVPSSSVAALWWGATQLRRGREGKTEESGRNMPWRGLAWEAEAAEHNRNAHTATLARHTPLHRICARGVGDAPSGICGQARTHTCFQQFDIIRSHRGEPHIWRR